MSRDSAIRSQIRDEIHNIRSYAYDWNGVGGLPIRSDVFALLEWLLPMLCAYDDRLLFRLGVPNVELNPDGTVDWFWEYCGRSLILTFLCDGTIRYVRFFEDEATNITGTICHEGLTKIDREISSLIHWICTGLLLATEVRTK